jgi:hypothetical protein
LFVISGRIRLEIEKGPTAIGPFEFQFPQRSGIGVEIYQYLRLFPACMSRLKAEEMFPCPALWMASFYRGGWNEMKLWDGYDRIVGLIHN